MQQWLNIPPHLKRVATLTLWNIYVIQLACSASCGNLAEKWTLQNSDAWQAAQAAFWALNDMIIVLPSALTGNLKKNIRYISFMKRNDVTHFTDWGITSLLTYSICWGAWVWRKFKWSHPHNIHFLLVIKTSRLYNLRFIKKSSSTHGVGTNLT